VKPEPAYLVAATLHTGGPLPTGVSRLVLIGNDGCLYGYGEATDEPPLLVRTEHAVFPCYGRVERRIGKIPEGARVEPVMWRGQR
jgi:hypothetical protein